MTGEMRIVALRSGFEVLLGVGENVDRMRGALVRLVPAERGRRRSRRWTTRSARRESRVMTDLEWWFTKFSFLRNAIVHGYDVPPGQFRFGGVWHMWIGEASLRAAIKETVAAAGFPLVRMDSFERAERRALDRLGAL
jgi:hypothetical protein